jgi:hypothetical protein
LTDIIQVVYKKHFKKIYAHSPIELPHVLDFGLAVGPNIEMFVSLQAEVTMAEKDIQSLTPVNS